MYKITLKMYLISTAVI